MGNFKLAAAQVARLGLKDKMYQWKDEGKRAIAVTESTMTQHGLAPFKLRGEYFVSSTEDNDNYAEHIGQFRLKHVYNECGTVTIIA